MSNYALAGRPNQTGGPMPQEEQVHQKHATAQMHAREGWVNMPSGSQYELNNPMLSGSGNPMTYPYKIKQSMSMMTWLILLVIIAIAVYFLFFHKKGGMMGKIQPPSGQTPGGYYYF
jgi:hypothetical protein